ncbi:coiled-coil domain-containing protein [Chryseobacterium kwangjuense]|uniref:Uncharacterized protein n=1 Tax=Chryseobacterium kwangjuense TaxID=267125 RepID=A0A135W468_9FLAO|nr:hypothetical protein [Chryseobacterium kwangjuense]KXH79703.1 hypothetical protein AU378_20295 [Chryseobacterium kwangjuense]
MKFKFDEFAKYIHEKFSSDFTIKEIKELLYLEEDGYNKSIPDSHQKRLLLKRIILKGTKDQEEFIYDKLLFSGVSMWLADNLKGKSTIFKAIGFALTGRDKFTPMVKSWIKQISLQFSVHNAEYTVVLNLAGAQLKAFVYGCSIDNIEGTEELASFKSRDSFTAYMQNLFFEEFGYYPIKRVQATQSSVNLSDADLSWVSYYSSIYHQSKDYGSLEIGNQHSMVFQMLLGLQYTYSIHALDVKARKVERELSLRNEEQKQDATGIDAQQLKTDLEKIEGEIVKLSSSLNKDAISTLEENIRILQNSREVLRRERIQNEEKLYKFRKSAVDLQSQLEDKMDKIRQANKEINKQRKLIIEYQEYIDSGIFFNDLVVTECPHCDHEVDRVKLKIEKESKVCMLCDHQMEEKHGDTMVWEQRKREADEEILNNKNLILKQEELLNELKEAAKFNKDNTNEIQHEIGLIEKEISGLQEEIVPLEDSLSSYIETSSQDYFPKLEGLLRRKVDVESQLEKFERERENLGNSANRIKKQIEVLRLGHNLMLNRRRNAGANILKELEDIMLGQLHALGLPSYTGVEINPDNFVIRYHQGLIVSNFSDISEGEQLRAKLALYLSLIELDLSKGLGRHPRLIILDSPTKEEGDLQFVEGLKNALIHIEKNFADKVQVIVGTANRELRTVINNPEKLEYRGKSEFMF